MVINMKNYTVIRAITDEGVDYRVVENKDNFAWSKSGSPRGAVIDALKQGIKLSKIDMKYYKDDIGFINIKKELGL